MKLVRCGKVYVGGDQRADFTRQQGNQYDLRGSPIREVSESQQRGISSNGVVRLGRCWGMGAESLPESKLMGEIQTNRNFGGERRGENVWG